MLYNENYKHSAKANKLKGDELATATELGILVQFLNRIFIC